MTFSELRRWYIPQVLSQMNPKFLLTGFSIIGNTASLLFTFLNFAILEFLNALHSSCP